MPAVSVGRVTRVRACHCRERVRLARSCLVGGAHGVTRPTVGVMMRRPSLEHLGAGGAFGILELAMLGDNQRAPQRDHHEDAQQAAEQPHEHDPADLKVEPEDHDRRHGDPEAEGDGLARRAGGLDDVVLQDGGVASAGLRPQPEQRQRNHRDRDGGADREADLQDEVERRSAEHHAQQRAEDNGARRAFAHGHAGRDVRLEHVPPSALSRFDALRRGGHFL